MGLRFDTVQRRTADWVVKADSYVDTAFILRRDIKDCFKKTWADGQADIKAIAIHHYEIDPEHLEECAPLPSSFRLPGVQTCSAL